MPQETRYPAVGTTLRKSFNGVMHTVTVEEQGFRLDGGTIYRSLTATAEAINGGRTVNGWTFFGLTNPNPVRRRQDGQARANDAARQPAPMCSAVKGKCNRSGCYEPADCKHGFCHRHCTHGHEILSYNGRKYPRNNERHIGVEIEVKYSNRDDYRRGLPLEGHRDGSLGSYGAEYKLLAKATDIAQQASELVQELWKRGARIDRKCGLHVHLDIRQLSGDRITEMRDWLKRTQDTWFALMPPSRRNNHYASRIDDYDSHYTWANQTSYNTFEIRLHGGTLNPFKISGWLTALIHVQNKANDAAYQFPNTGDAEADFWALFADCPTEGIEYLTTRRNNAGVVADRAFRHIEE